MNIENGQIPRVYTFKIKAEVRGDNTYWTNYLSLTINCLLTPTLVPNYLTVPY